MADPKVLFQDDSLLVLDKPSGWVVNDADTTKRLNTVQGWIRKNFQFPISNSQSLRSGIVHRLDKETSGVLLVAKTKEAFENLQKQFKERKIEKTYIAMVHREVGPKSGEINVPTGRLPWNRRKFGVIAGGREALTQYKVLSIKYLDKNPYTLLELYPKTGRTHQIRIHLKHIGHPIVSDKTYVGRKTWRYDSKWCSRMFLHASKISVHHPQTGKKVSFESRLAEDLKKAQDSLE